MSKSIVQSDCQCFLCGRETMLERHHILGGPNRRLSERWGIWCYLCHEDHVGVDGAQYNRETGDYLKREAQKAFEELYGHDKWMALFRKNYL